MTNAFKNFMVTLTLGLVLTLFSVSVHAHDVLWNKAVALTKKSEESMPRKMKEIETVKDENGKRVEQTVSLYSLEPRTQHSANVILLKSTKDGKENKMNKQKEIVALGGKNELLDTDNLFHPLAQKRVSITKLSKQKIIMGITCTVYEFTHRTSSGVVKGKAYLDGQTGVPIKTTSWALKLPPEKDDVKVNSITSTTWYALSSKGELRIKRMYILTKLKIDGFMFMKYNLKINTVLTFYDYR